MIKNSSRTLMSAGVFSAFAASLCCITPVIALVAGSSSIAACFSWIEPARPYLIGLSIAVLGFAWYLKIGASKTKNMDCNCEVAQKSSFFQSKGLLGIVTVFAILMMSFPLYAKVFYSKPKAQAAIVVAPENKQQVKFTIEGMTCQGCEEHINKELAKVSGVIAYKTSYASGSSLVSFDKEKVQVTTIASAINKTGYKVKGYELVGSPEQACCKKN